MYNNERITDIHAHILPGVDDGPRSEEDSITLLHAMAEAGVHRCFCTPHYRNPHFDVSLEEVKHAYNSCLIPAVSSTQLRNDFEFELGAEIRLGTPFEHDLMGNTVPTLGSTNYVLVEFPTVELPSKLFDYIHELKVAGYRVILAHPERYLSIQRNPDIIDELLSMGVLMQLTAGCFLKSGKDLHTPDKLAWSLLERGKAHFVASDAHNVTSRCPNLVQAYAHIEIRFGEAMVRQLIANANAAWENADCIDIEPVSEKTRKRSLFSLFSK